MVEITATEWDIEKRMKKKIFEEKVAKNFTNTGKEIVNQVQEVQSPKQDKPKEVHIKTHSNQTDKN